MGTKRLEDDALAIYMREVIAIPALTGDEEIKLCQHVFAADVAQILVSAAPRLVSADISPEASRTTSRNK